MLWTTTEKTIVGAIIGLIVLFGILIYLAAGSVKDFNDSNLTVSGEMGSFIGSVQNAIDEEKSKNKNGGTDEI